MEIRYGGSLASFSFPPLFFAQSPSLIHLQLPEVESTQVGHISIEPLKSGFRKCPKVQIQTSSPKMAGLEGVHLH